MLRRFVAAVCFVLGVISLVLWAVSALIVKTVEDGTVVTGVAQKVVEQPRFTNLITERLQVLVSDELAESGVDLEALGLKAVMDNVVAAAVQSDTFQRALVAAVDGARADFAVQLKSPEAEGQPLVLKLDVSAAVNQSIADTPVLGEIIPQLSFEPLALPVAEASTFAKMRGTYRWIDRLATWAGWFGLLLLGAGIALTPRKRWLIPLGLLWAGLGAGALWAVLRWFTVERLVSRLPDEGTGADLRDAIVRYAPQDSVDAFAGRALVVSIACLIAAAVAYIAVKVISGPETDQDAKGRPRGRHEADMPEHAR